MSYGTTTDRTSVGTAKNSVGMIMPTTGTRLIVLVNTSGLTRPPHLSREPRIPRIILAARKARTAREARTIVPRAVLSGTTRRHVQHQEHRMPLEIPKHKTHHGGTISTKEKDSGSSANMVGRIDRMASSASMASPTASTARRASTASPQARTASTEDIMLMMIGIKTAHQRTVHFSCTVVMPRHSL